jgi:hypothetical protein
MNAWVSYTQNKDNHCIIHASKLPLELYTFLFEPTSHITTIKKRVSQMETSGTKKSILVESP